MSDLLRQRDDATPGRRPLAGLLPTHIEFRSGAESVVHFDDGRAAAGACIRCHDAPCMKWQPTELETSNLAGFPAERSPDTCATGAMSVNPQTRAPVINAATCVSCGVCALRCPVGAIRLDPVAGAIVNDSSNSIFVETDRNPERQVTDVRALFARVPGSGELLRESPDAVDAAMGRVIALRSTLGDQYPNSLARGLFRAVGIDAAMRRKGNNHLRMDLILGPAGVGHGVAEVEFGDDAVLDTPRDILDDIAVLTSRHAWPRERTASVAVADVLPNRRSEYWRIVQDVRKVVGLRIGTVTVLALMLLAWQRKRLHLTNDLFYVDVDSDSYRSVVLEKIIGRGLALGDAPRPWVEIAK